MTQLFDTAESVFDLDGDVALQSHEKIKVHRDPVSGLAAIIAIHDTRLGPALGGTRFHAYPSVGHALSDVLRLSEGMTFKAAVAGLPFGGGKAVILGDPRTGKTPELLREYARFVNTLDGEYVTAGDVGTTATDMDFLRGYTPHVVGRTPQTGGYGDSGVSTALGVYISMRAAVRAFHGPASQAPLSVAVEGAGKVGLRLIEMLVESGARVSFSDPDPKARDRVLAMYSEVECVESALETPADVYAPCALGATLTPLTVSRLGAGIVCGGANNQLATPGVENELVAAGRLWVPDYVANAGGLVQVAAERLGEPQTAIRPRLDALDQVVTRIVRESRRSGTTPGTVARAIADERLAAAGPRVPS